jgi:hypothetical protein
VTALERTAYPRFKRRPSAKELAEVYTPTTEDLAFVRGIARGAAPTLTAMVLLKSFERLGYLPRLQDVPFAVIGHIRSSLRLPPDTALDVTPRTLYRHRQSIRDYLQVRDWGREARHVAVEAAYRAAQVMNHPADLINVAIEELARQRFELPAFSTLDELARHVRAVVDRRLFDSVMVQLSEKRRRTLDQLLESDQLGRSAFNTLKQPPKQPSLSRLDHLVGHIRWLQELWQPVTFLSQLRPAKVQHLAAEARSLDAAEVRRVGPAKRYSLLLCLIARAQVQGRDDLAETFCKRIARIETRAKEELASRAPCGRSRLMATSSNETTSRSSVRIRPDDSSGSATTPSHSARRSHSTPNSLCPSRSTSSPKPALSPDIWALFPIFGRIPA